MTEAPQPPEMPPPAPAGPSQQLRPHRGGAVLALGILGLVVCIICGIIAWSMGSSDLKEMAAGRMDRSGEGLTKAGKICGMVSVILTLAVLCIWLLVVGLASCAGGLSQ